MQKKKQTIILPFLSGILPVIAASLVIIIILFNSILKEQVYSVKTELGRTVTGDIEKGFETWIEDQIILAESFAAEPAVIDVCSDPSDKQAYERAYVHLSKVRESRDYYENIFLILYHDNPSPHKLFRNGEVFRIDNGSVFLSSGGNYVMGKGDDRNYSTAIRNGSSFFLSEVFESIESRTPVFTVTVPVMNREKLIGAVGLTIKSEYFTSKFGTQEHFGENEYVFIMDDDGQVISHKDDALVLTEEGRKTLEPFLARIQNDQYEFILEYKGAENIYIAKKMESFPENRANDWYLFYRESLDDMFRVLGTIQLKSAFLIVFALLAAGTVIYLLARLIILQPLRSVGTELNTIAEGGGDLTTNIEIKTGNEVGAIGTSFNRFTETLRKMISRIKESVKLNKELRYKLASSTEETSAAVNEILSNIQSIQNTIQNLVNETDTAGSSMTGIGGAIDELTGQAENQSAAVEQSTAAVEQMVSSLKNMAGVTERNKAVSDKLLKSAEDSGSMLDETYSSIQKVTTNIDSIREMTDVIDNISSQTNLLAMNAAIEAAHAGEAGKGFAVVADEIRKLAEDSGTSSNKIASEVKTIVDQIRHSSDNSKQLQLVMTEMVTGIKDLARAFTEINSSSIEMSAGSDQVLKAMSSLSELSIKLSAAADTMKQGTERVGTNIDSVRQLTQTARAAMEEISFGSSEILQAMMEMQENVRELGDSTDELSSEVENFRT